MLEMAAQATLLEAARPAGKLLAHGWCSIPGSAAPALTKATPRIHDHGQVSPHKAQAPTQQSLKVVVSS